MKNLYTFLLVFAIPFLGISQLYFEDFESGMPDDYHLVNIDGLTPDDPDLETMADSAWTVRSISSQGWEGGNSAFSVSWYVGDEGPSDDWMVTPEIEVGSESYLYWDAMAITSSGDYRDRYQVFIGTDTAITYFAGLAPVFDTGDEGELDSPITRSLDLASLGFQDQTIHVAFRNWTQPFDPDAPIGPGNGGNELCIDNIMVTEGLNVNDSKNINSINLYPNPVADQCNLSFNLLKQEELTIQILDYSGRVVSNENFDTRSNGIQNIQLNTSELSNGSYLIRISGENTYSMNKITVIK